jgi:UDP-N-acetylmuramyl tripeptide synthase
MVEARPITVNQFLFTQEREFFVVCTSEGFRVHSTATGMPTKIICNDIPNGTKLAQTYKRTDLVFFVGSGFNADFPSSKLVIWSMSQRAPVAEGFFQSSIIDLQVIGDWVVVTDQTKVSVFDF